MSTRCQIGFYSAENKNFLKPDVLLYRHSDGYPGKVDGSEYGVLPDLVPFLRLFHKRRGLDDVEYAAAWTMHHLIAQHVQHIKEYAATQGASPYLPADGLNMIGFGICADFHGDIEYYYGIRGNCLAVYEVNWPSSAEQIQKRFFKPLSQLFIARNDNEQDTFLRLS